MPKISELPLANKLKEEDYIPIVQDGVTKKVKGTHFVTEEEYSLDTFSPTIVANDKAMYKFGEGDNVDFSESAYDGAYKSAILKGMTETILDRFENGTYNAWSPTFIKGDNTKRIRTINQYSGVSGSITVSVNEKYEVNVVGHNTSTSTGIGGEWQTTLSIDVTNSIFAFVIRKKDGTDITKDEIHDVNLVTSFKQLTDMVSVKMPVLTTTGKNLFDGEVEGGSFDNWGNKTDSYNSKRSINLIEVKPNTKYKIVKPFTDWHSIIGFKENDFSKPINDSIGSHAVIDSSTSQIQEFTTSPTTKFLALVCVNSIDISQTMIVAGSETNYTFEPHKSNILSTPSDLELRGIGDVRDELNLITGELTENVKKMTLNGSENWTLNGTYSNFIELVGIGKLQHSTVGFCDKLPKANITASSENNPVGFMMVSHDGVRLKPLEGNDNSLEDYKQWLKENPVSIYFLPQQKSIKTVDLSGTPFGYKGGHIIKSSAEGSLLPKFEYEVAVSRGAQISQNTSTLIKHDEKITELLKKTATTYINQKAEIAYLLNMSSTLEEVQTIPFIEDDYVNDDCMVDSDMVMDNMEVEPEKEIIDNADTLLINLIYDLIELNDTLGLSEKVELFRQSGLIDKHNYEIIKEKLNPTFKEEDYAGINQ